MTRLWQAPLAAGLRETQGGSGETYMEAAAMPQARDRRAGPDWQRGGGEVVGSLQVGMEGTAEHLGPTCFRKMAPTASSWGGLAAEVPP